MFKTDIVQLELSNIYTKPTLKVEICLAKAEFIPNNLIYPPGSLNQVMGADLESAPEIPVFTRKKDRGM